MLATDRFCPRSEDLQQLRAGLIGPQLQSFAALLSEQGYCSDYGWRKMRLVAGLSRWLQRRHIPLTELNETRIAMFLNNRRKRGQSQAGDRCTMALLLRHLRRANIVPPLSPVIRSDIDLICQEYESFLLEERGLVRSSTDSNLTAARRFLSHRFPSGKVYLTKLRARDVTDFVLYDSAKVSPKTVQRTATALRSLFGFLFQKGRLSTNLRAAVPMVAVRRLAELPRYLEPGQVEKVLRCCDRRRKVGKRDYAILLVLARLGLRAGELVRLTLEDIDWRAGELLVRGKGARLDRLPLMQDVGQALADYLQNGRPDCSSRRVFIQCNAPHVGFPSHASTVCSIVRQALTRADIKSPHMGAHVLRHSLATRMLRNGATLAQIGQVLRHQLPQTTQIYAKVDLNALRALALPWQGGVL
jgi:site-specific recombinase XerD